MYSFPCVQTELLYRRGGKNHDTTDKSHFSFAGRKGKGKRKRIDPLPTWTAKSQPIERILSFKKKKNRTNSRISVIACRKPTRPQSNHSNRTQKRPTFRPHQQIEPDRTGKSTTDQESHLSPRLKPNSPEMPGCRTRTMWSMEQRRRGRGPRGLVCCYTAQGREDAPPPPRCLRPGFLETYKFFCLFLEQRGIKTQTFSFVFFRSFAKRQEQRGGGGGMGLGTRNCCRNLTGWCKGSEKHGALTAIRLMFLPGATPTRGALFGRSFSFVKFMWSSVGL